MTEYTEADLIYQRGWNDCLRWIIEDLEKELDSNGVKRNKLACLKKEEGR